MPCPGNARSASASRACFHFRSSPSVMPSLRAASVKLSPWSVTSLTASTLNSRVNVRRVPIIDLLTGRLRS